MMFNKDFYPTPQNVALKMQDKIENWKHRTILEPSAGKGDLAEVFTNRGYYGESRSDIDVVEQEPELQEILKSKGHRVVASDFLTYSPSKYYNLIVMNPPFSAGSKHLLHAWEILIDGDILCLLNAETIRNPHTKERQLLNRIINENGTVEYLGDVFRSAERKTGVEVVLVHLTKTGDLSMFDFEADDKGYIADMTGIGESADEVAMSDGIEAMVSAFDAAKRAFSDLWKARRRIGSYMSYGGGTAAHDGTGCSKNFDILYEALRREHPVAGYNFFVAEMANNFWNKVFQKTKFQDKMTKKVKEQFEKFRKENNLDFTVKNVESVLDTLMNSTGMIRGKCIEEAFDLMTKYYKENRVHVEGWKSNKAYMVSRKVVLPNMVAYDYGGKYRVQFSMYRNPKDITDDIDRAMCFISGQSFSNILTIGRAVEDQDQSEKTATSTFFEIRYYKKGTMHLKFRDEDLWKRFNIEVGKTKNWIGDM